MVLIIHKELVRVSDQWTEKAQAPEAGPNDQKQIQISSMWITHTGSIHVHVLQSWLINTVYLKLRGITGRKGGS